MLKKRSIIFSNAEMVALLDGVKTHLIKAIKLPATTPGLDLKKQKFRLSAKTGCIFVETGISSTWAVDCPYGKVGDILYIRETFCKCKNNDMLCYKANMDIPQLLSCEGPISWRSPISMLKKETRIGIRIKDIQIIELQEVTFDDILNEGIWVDPPRNAVETFFPNGFEKRTPEEKEDFFKDAARTKYFSQCHHADELLKKFQSTWDFTNSNGFKWVNNPHVWIIKFERI